MTTNKELVRQLAIEMAKVRAIEIDFTPWDEMTSDERRGMIDASMSEATIAVKFGEKMFEEGYVLGWSKSKTVNPDNHDAFLNKGMFERGLIAGKEGEDE